MSLTDQQRREWIARRQTESAFWRIIHILGSLQLAMVLLFTLALACAIATVTESHFNQKVAQHYIYRATWFNFWLTVLCLNLFCAAFTRWPWQRKHLGFVVTHAGIIILLIGAMIGRSQGFEGSITLNKGEEPQNRIIINETVLEVESPTDASIYTMPFPVEVHPPTVEHPRILPLPGTLLKLKVEKYASNLVEVGEIRPSDNPQSGPGVALHFRTNLMNQDIDATLLTAPASARQFEFPLGLAKVEWLDQLPTNPAKPAAVATFRETQVVLAASPDQPVIVNDAKEASGYRFRLASDDNKKWVLQVQSPQGAQAQFELSSILKKPVHLENDPVQITVSEFWPNFTMQEGKPVSLGKDPLNPAVMIQLSGPRPASSGKPDSPVLQLAPVGSGKIRYQLVRQGAIYAHGEAGEGESFSLGWADWQAKIVHFEPHAALVQKLQETAPSNRPGMNTGAPGILARLIDRSGKEGAPLWVLSGTSQTLLFNDQFVRIGFGLKTHPLPFTIALKNFEVPRDEGTDTPSDFIATVQFNDPIHNVTAEGQAHMNYPASFPGQFWRSVLGRNYKFSQASWNPNNLNETTLQVLFDPGWPLKWSGSLMICIGIALMFYFKSNSPRKNANTQPKSAPDLVS